MAKIEVKGIKATMTRSRMEPPWQAEVSYGPVEVVIPLPAVNLITDDFSQMHRDWVEGLEGLARALLYFAAGIREKYPGDFD